MSSQGRTGQYVECQLFRAMSCFLASLTSGHIISCHVKSMSQDNSGSMLDEEFSHYRVVPWRCLCRGLCSLSCSCLTQMLVNSIRSLFLCGWIPGSSSEVCWCSSKRRVFGRALGFAFLFVWRLIQKGVDPATAHSEESVSLPSQFANNCRRLR